MELSVRQIEALRLISASNSLQEIIDLSFQVLENPMFYQDIDQSIPFYTRGVQIENENWERITSGSLTMEQVSAKNDLEDFYTLYQQQRDVLELPQHPNQPADMRNYIIPMLSGNVRQGCLILTSHSRPFRDGDKALFRLIAEMFRLKLSSAISNENIGKSLTERFLITLLGGGPIDPDYVAARMDALAWKPDPFLFCMVIQSVSDERLTESIANLLYALSFSRKHKAVAFQHTIAFIYSSDHPSVDIAHDIPELYKLLVQMHLCAGISNCFSDIMDLAVYYRQAVHSLRVGQFHRPDTLVYDFRDLQFECLLDVWKDRYSLDEYMDPMVKRLYQEDRQRNTHLIETLSTWLSCRMNVEQTAEKLLVHKNTIRYRLNQCEEMTGYHLSRGEDLFRIECALKAIAFQDNEKPT